MAGRALLALCTFACGSPRTVPAPPSPPVPAVAADAAIARTPPAADAPEHLELPALADRYYELVHAGRGEDARALVENRDGACPAETGVTKRRDGGFIVYGGRVAVRLDARGAYESHAVLAGCAQFVDEQVDVIDIGDAYVLSGATAQSERFTEATFAEATSEWVLLGNDAGHVAWARGAATLLRSTGGSGDRRARIVGSYLLTSEPALELHRRDGSRAAIKGCKGHVRAAVPIPGGLALHVGREADASDTSLCMVTDRGTTRRVVTLGRATCGLAEAMPCPWELAAHSSRLLVFAGLRGGVVVIDATSGAKLRYRGEPPAQFPATYSTCGDAVCVSTSSDADPFGEIVSARGAAMYRAGPKPTPTDVDSVRETWCTQADLLVRCSP